MKFLVVTLLQSGGDGSVSIGEFLTTTNGATVLLLLFVITLVFRYFHYRENVRLINTQHPELASSWNGWWLISFLTISLGLGQFVPRVCGWTELKDAITIMFIGLGALIYVVLIQFTEIIEPRS